MKIRILGIIMLCGLLVGCANAKTQPDQPAPTVPVETKVEAAAVISPLEDNTMEALEDSIVNISFEQDGFILDDAGNAVLRMKIYSYDKFDMLDISVLKAGDTIILSGEEILVNSVEHNDRGTVLVNGGLDEGGFDLATDDSGIYYAHGYSDMKSWNLVGEAELPVSGSFIFRDGVDLEKGEVTYTAADLAESVPGIEFGYQPQNTTARIENGQVVEMNRIYTP